MKIKSIRQFWVILLALQMNVGITYAQAKLQDTDLKNFPKGSTPLEVGQLVAECFVATPHPNFGRPTPPRDITYAETCAWYGAEMVVYLDSLQQINGFFYHAPDVPFFWGRGNVWMAAGMSELLRSLPKNNPNRKQIMEGYKTMMVSLLKYQSESGMWHQLIDDPESWPETSSTGMFTFATINGVKNGWLDKKIYGPAAARKGCLTLVSYIDENGDTREVCEGSNKKNSRQYYLDRKRNVGDMHGQAPVL